MAPKRQELETATLAWPGDARDRAIDAPGRSP